MTQHRTVRTATEATLKAAGALHSPMGQLAMNLARRIDAGDETGSAHAALAKELRATMTEALRGGSTVADPVDELARKRAERQRRAKGATS